MQAKLHATAFLAREAGYHRKRIFFCSVHCHGGWWIGLGLSVNVLLWLFVSLHAHIARRLEAVLQAIVNLLPRFGTTIWRYLGRGVGFVAGMMGTPLQQIKREGQT